MESSGLICHYGVDLTHPHLFQKNPNQSCPKKMINKYANTCCSSKRHGVNINMTLTFFEVKKFFLKRKKQRQKFDLFKNCEMSNFLELPAFYIEYKKVKFMAINFRVRTNVKYSFAKIRYLVKITTKSTHFLPAKKKIPLLWIELQTNKIQKVSTQNLTSKHRTVKSLQIAKSFLRKCE